jgi:hypothetical protein
MAVAAVRYCLGRKSYIVGDCKDWLIDQWLNISAKAQDVIRRDVEEAFEADDRARAAGNQYKPLGWDCDRDDWERVRVLWGGRDPRA